MIAFKLYEYNNKLHRFASDAYSEEDINFIDVKVISGDETITIFWKNGNILDYDTGVKTRTIDYLDYAYIVDSPEEIHRWLCWQEPEGNVTYSYKRRDDFVL